MTQLHSGDRGEWFRLGNEDDVTSPALLVYSERIEENLRRRVATAGGPDVLLAYHPVGPHVRRVVELAEKYPSIRFSRLADNGATLVALREELRRAGLAVPRVVAGGSPTFRSSPVTLGSNSARKRRITI